MLCTNAHDAMKSFTPMGRMRWFAACAAAVMTLGCGGGGNAGNEPLPPAPSGAIVSIAINSSAPTVFLGATETFSAVATYTSGATQTVTGGAWTSDAPAVVGVDGRGQVIGLANGEATISIDYQGVRGSKHIRVLPNYGGSWIGNYTVVSCTNTEGFADQNVCGNFNVGQTFQYRLQFTQTADVVSGLTAIGLIGSTTTSSTVNADGSLTFTPQVFVGTVQIDLTWHLTSVVPNVINGTVTQTWTDVTTPGQMVVEGALQSPTKQSASSR